MFSFASLKTPIFNINLFITHKIIIIVLYLLVFIFLLYIYLDTLLRLLYLVLKSILQEPKKVRRDEKDIANVFE